MAVVQERKVLHFVEKKNKLFSRANDALVLFNHQTGLGVVLILFMAESINWLHLTDLHFGLDPHGWLWPQIKHEFFQDVAKLAADVGRWDLVFFTGDLTQRGSKEEFDHLSKELDELWAVLAKSGSTPKLCVVPGNHDLERPPPELLVAKSFDKLWWTDPNLRRNFWADPQTECRKAVHTFFANYSAWLASLSIPTLTTKLGQLPGDFSATFEKGGLKLGIVGLNSTFLQIADGEFKGKLDLHISQLNAVCDGDATLWLRNRAANVLLTHQPPSWLSSEALRLFRQDIYPPGRFLSQLCGHQHEPETTEIVEAGAQPRRLRQGPSLFGLENWKGVTPQKRIHGYAAGQFIFEEAGGLEKLWPRIAIPGLHGGLNIAPDHRYRLTHDCIVTRFDINEKAPVRQTVPGKATSPEDLADAKSAAEPKAIELHLLEAPPDEPMARQRLAACPRFPQAAGAQHRHIRLEEQSQFEFDLRKGRCVWVAADWGIGKEGFLVSAIERFRTADTVPEVFHIKCDEATNIDALEALFPQQCGMSLQAFCGFLGVLKGAFLVLDGIDTTISKGDQLLRLTRVASAILDYCPELRLILLSRLLPESTTLSSLELHPLEVPDVRTYLMHHSDSTPDLWEADTVERLHWHSGGLPMHLDKMLRALKVSSIAAVLEEEMESAPGTETLSESAPKALIHAVSTLAKSKDKSSQRSFRLLKVLSVLPYGETLDALHHYLPVEPFFYENAFQLREFALLDVVPLQQTLPKAGLTIRDDQNAPKLLKVPRQVRDYVQTLLSEEESREIFAAGAERYFGRRWRDGKVKLRNLPAEYRDYLSSGAGNEFAVIHHLIAQARKAADHAAVRKAAKLGILYARHLSVADRYRDLAIVTAALVQTVDRNEYPNEWSDLASLYGEGLRMTDKDEEAIKYCHAALELGESHFSDDEKATIWLSIALAQQDLNNKDAALEAAEKVTNYSQQSSADRFSAMALIADLTLGEPAKTIELTKIQRDARQKGYNEIESNISFMLANECEKPSEEKKHLDRVLETSTPGTYNFFRGIVSKARAVQKMQGESELRPQEILHLISAYSYFHGQRFTSLFDSCHNALWRVYEPDDNPARLLRLFRHSSFVWRIRGDEDREKRYLARLRKRKIEPTDSSIPRTFVIEIGYYMRRLKIVLIDAIAPETSQSG